MIEKPVYSSGISIGTFMVEDQIPCKNFENGGNVSKGRIA